MQPAVYGRIGSWAPIPFRAWSSCSRGSGIKVLSVDLTNIDGLTARARRGTAGFVSVIVVNRATCGERQRFTASHELGHMVLRVAPDVDAEKAAHRFAGAFLMPAEALRAEMGARRTSIGWSELFDLKQLFGVSVQALTVRCRDLGIFDTALYQRLFRDFSRFGWRSPPYEEPIPEAQRTTTAVRAPLLPRARGRRSLRGQGRGVAGCLGSRPAPAHGGTAGHGGHWPRVDRNPDMVVVSDTSVLIDLERASLLTPSFCLRFDFAVPDLLYERELKSFGGEDMRKRGMRVEALDSEGWPSPSSTDDPVLGCRCRTRSRWHSRNPTAGRC